MIETRVRVLRTQGDTAWVEATEQRGCAACQVQSACAVSGLGRLFASRRRPIPMCVADARPGQELTLVLSEADFLRAGLLAYLLPVALALAGAALAASLGAADAWAALGMVTGFATGLGLAARMAHRITRPTRAVDPEPPSLTQGETP